MAQVDYVVANYLPRIAEWERENTGFDDLVRALSLKTIENCGGKWTKFC